MAVPAYVKDANHILKVDQMVACHRVAPTTIMVQVTTVGGPLTTITFGFTDAATCSAYWAQLNAATP